jgi:cbb3-type cytochrome oxidase subunit 3
MMSQVLAKAPWAWLTCIGLVIFFCFFVSMLMWVYRKGGKEFYAELSTVPFENDGVTKP